MTDTTPETLQTVRALGEDVDTDSDVVEKRVLNRSACCEKIHNYCI